MLELICTDIATITVPLLTVSSSLLGVAAFSWWLSRQFSSLKDDMHQKIDTLSKDLMDLKLESAKQTAAYAPAENCLRESEQIHQLRERITRLEALMSKTTTPK